VVQQLAGSQQIRAEAAGTSLDAEIDEVIAAILLSRFSGRSVPEICAMGGITVDDFTNSVLYREIFELGRQEGERLAYQQEWQEGRRIESAVIAQIWLQRCCGPITPCQKACIEALPYPTLESLHDVLFDFKGPDDLNVWLSRHADLADLTSEGEQTALSGFSQSSPADAEEPNLSERAIVSSPEQQPAASQPEQPVRPVVASDKLFYWLFQQHAERLQPLVAGLLPQMEGYVFSAPVLKEREYRLDGLFLPPADQPELPTLILEAQMAADPGFLLRLNAETGRLLQQQDRQGRPIRHWQVVVICPSRELNFGDPTPVREFVRERVVWIELAPERLPRTAPPLQRALGMLLLPEDQLPVCSASIRAEAAGTSLGAEIDDVIAAILVSRFSGRTVPEICAMGGITVDDFTSSVAYREIFGLGQQKGRQAEAAAISLRLLAHRFGALTSSQQSRIQALPLSSLEALLDALLDSQGPEDLNTWLSHHAA